MGEIYNLLCECGYEKKLELGGGIGSSNLETVTRVFSKESLSEFNKNYINNNVKSFFIENVIAYCNECCDITSTTVLNVKNSNETDLQIVNRCYLCGNDLKILTDLPNCPRCGYKMIKKQVGYWD